MSNKNVIVITGANRGLGYEVSKQIAQTESLQPYIIYCTSRKADTTDLKTHFPNSEVRFTKLDVTKQEQIEELAAQIKKEGHPLKILVNNGALADDTRGFTKEIAKEMIDVNYRGCLKLSQAMIPLMVKGSRIVNVSAAASQQENLMTSPEQKAIIQNPNITIEDVNGLIAKFEVSFFSE